MNRPPSVIPVLFAALFLTGAFVQSGYSQTNAFPVTASYGLDGLVGSSTAGGVYTTNTNVVGTVSGNEMRPSTPGAHYTMASLGLGFQSSIQLNINAFANLADVYPEDGILDIAGSEADVTIEFSVSRDPGGIVGPSQLTHEMPPGGFAAVQEQYDTDGACSDTFIARCVGSERYEVVQGSNHLGIYGSQGTTMETEIDAIGSSERTAFPVFYSVDKPTAIAMSAQYQVTFRASDIIIKESATADPRVYRAGSMMGLQVGDDIDALMMDRRRNEEFVEYDIVFSLSRDSRSLDPAFSNSAIFFEVGAAGLYRYYWELSTTPGPLPIEPWAHPQNLGLTSANPFNSTVGRDLDGVAAHDPPVFTPDVYTAAPTPEMNIVIAANPDGRNDLLRIDESNGGRDGVLRIETTRPTKVTMNKAAIMQPAKFFVVGRIGSYADGDYTRTHAHRVTYVGIPSMTELSILEDLPLHDLILMDSYNFGWGLPLGNMHNFASAPAILDSDNIEFHVNFPPVPAWFEARFIVQAFAYPAAVDLLQLDVGNIEVGNSIELLWNSGL